MTNRVSVSSTLFAALALCALAVAPRGLDQDFKLKGTLIDAFCVKKLGTGKVLSPDHIACARECFSKGEQLGIFDEDLGLVKIVGKFPADNRAKIIALLGKEVEATGSRIRGGDYSALIDITTITLVQK